MRAHFQKIDDFLEVYLGDECILTVDRSFAKSELISWEVSSKSEFFELFRPLEDRYAFKAAVIKLSRRSMHSEQIKQVLKERYFSEGAIEAALIELNHLGIINDEDFEAHFVQKLQKLGKSTREIVLKASQRGISAKKVQALLVDECEALRIVVEKRYPELLEKNTPYAQKQKVMGALYRRGFSTSSIGKLVANTR